MPPTRTIIAFGSGPGIGTHTVSAFLSHPSHPFTHAVLLSRSPTRLTTLDAPSVSRANPSAKISTLPCDLSDLSSLPGVLAQLDALTAGENVEVVFFNAARIQPSGVLDVGVEEMGEDLRTTTLSLHLIATHFLPRLRALAQSSPESKPALLVTSSHLPWAPEPGLLSLSVSKAAQRAMVLGYRKAFEGSGVHVGLVSVEGVVSGEKERLNPGNIAKETVGFWEGGKGEDVRVRE